MLNAIIPALGTVLAIIGTIALVVIGRWLLDKYIADKRALSYQRQLFTFAAALLGFVAAIAVRLSPARCEPRCSACSGSS